MARSRFVLGLCVLAMAVSNLAHAQSLSHDPRSHGAPATPIILAPPCAHVVHRVDGSGQRGVQQLRLLQQRRLPH